MGCETKGIPLFAFAFDCEGSSIPMMQRYIYWYIGFLFFSVDDSLAMGIRWKHGNFIYKSKNVVEHTRKQSKLQEADFGIFMCEAIPTHVLFISKGFLDCMMDGRRSFAWWPLWSPQGTPYFFAWHLIEQ